ncbi:MULTISPECIES: hypothetical protein [Burkholderia]|uniref:hypothetical protein n=1 Tax=Burkholderia TaxID=32008 RepID=UPI00158F3951|nr:MULTISPECIES: hypothetical protein [Burkholderia]MBY4866424.1 hypothetical protein [Burkholderia anthina]
MSSLESIVGGAGGSLAAHASSLVDGMLLGDAAQFSVDDSPLSDALQLAGFSTQIPNS